MVMVFPGHSPATPSADDDLLATFLALDTPPGYRAELIDQEIIVTPPPQAVHEGIIARIMRAIIREAEPGLLAAGNRGLITPRGRFIPDITVAPETDYDAPGNWTGCENLALVCEVTSRDGHHNRGTKRLGYAGAGIPLYLLVDRDLERVTLFSNPEAEDYRTLDVTPFGKRAWLPEPFNLHLDTEPFA